MRYVIVGCGRMGAGLALALLRGGHDVAFVDDGSSTSEGLEPSLRGRLVAGGCFDRDTLVRAGIEQADGLAAVKKLCFDEKSVAPAELLEALKNDFEGAEDAQARLLIELQNLGLMVVSFKESGLALESLYMSLIMESR